MDGMYRFGQLSDDETTTLANMGSDVAIPHS